MWRTRQRYAATTRPGRNSGNFLLCCRATFPKTRHRAGFSRRYLAGFGNQQLGGHDWLFSTSTIEEAGERNSEMTCENMAENGQHGQRGRHRSSEAAWQIIKRALISGGGSIMASAAKQHVGALNQASIGKRQWRAQHAGGVIARSAMAAA